MKFRRLSYEDVRFLSGAVRFSLVVGFSRLKVRGVMGAACTSGHGGPGGLASIGGGRDRNVTEALPVRECCPWIRSHLM